ncbi:glycosyltransferase [Haloplanus sp. C73]|uniref:glycosyltransferase n=1 Tax=Haloplanus sp. C73 TaxID=3421641 RepID=UPI003EB6D1F7
MGEPHVALVTSWNRKGGIADYSERFAGALRRAGAEVTPVPIEHSDTANPRRFNRILDQIPSDADVIHVQFEAGLFGRLGMSGVCAPSFFRAAASMTPPVVTTLHEVHRTHSHQNPIGDRLLRARDFVIERAAIRASERTVVHTKTAKDILTDRHGRAERIVQMHHPVEVDATPVDQSTARSELGFDGPLLLTFGWIEEKKDYEQVVDVLPDLPEAQYLIAGEPRDEAAGAVLERTLDLAERRGVADRVHHLGYVDDDDVQTLFSAVDVVVLPYNRVSQSGTLNMALGYERPVLTTALDPFEELRAEFGCPETYEGTDELERTLATLLSDSEKRANLSERAAAYARELTWDRFGEESVALYRPIFDAD